MTADLPALVAALASGSLAERQAAAEKLGQLGSDAVGAAVALVEACDTHDDQLREWVAAALEGLGPPAAGDVARLASLVQCPMAGVAYWAATLLGRLQDGAAAAVPNLAHALRSHADLAVRERAAWALGKIGPPAQAARDAIAAAANSPDRRLARLAAEALARLRS